MGSRITAHYAGRKLLQEVSAGEGFSSTNTPYLIFGLDTATRVDSLVIEWLGGERQTLGPFAANQALVITQGQDTTKRIY